MKELRCVHVCMECGKSHCGCPDKTESSSPEHFSDGSYTIEAISRAINDEVSMKDLDCKRKEGGLGAWPVTIGTYLVDVH